MKAFSVILLLFAVSCSLGKKHHVGTTIIPSDYSDQSILLVEELPGKASANRKINKLLQKKYKGRYEMAASDEIYKSSGKFTDTGLYRFAIVSDFGQNYTMNSSNTSARTYTAIDYHIYDRATKKHYAQDILPASLPCLLRRC